MTVINFAQIGLICVKKENILAIFIDELVLHIHIKRVLNVYQHFSNLNKTIIMSVNVALQLSIVVNYYWHKLPLQNFHYFPLIIKCSRICLQLV